MDKLLLSDPRARAIMAMHQRAETKGTAAITSFNKNSILASCYG